MTNPWEKNYEVETVKRPWEKTYTTPVPTYDSSIIPAYEDLSTHTPWLKAAEEIYNIDKTEQTKWSGTDEELAQYGIEHMAWFNSNFTLGMAVDAVKLQSATQEQKEAFLYMMETFDEIDEPNLEALGRFTKGFLTDPATYVGITTLGFGLAGKEVGKVATKQGLKELLKQGIKRGGTIGAIEGGIYGAADARIREGIRVGGGAQDSVDYGNVLTGTAIGAVGGAILGTAADTGVTAITNKVARKDKLKQIKAERENRSIKVDEVDEADKVEVPKSTLEEPSVTPKQEETPEVLDIDGVLIEIPYYNTALTAPLRNMESITERAASLIPDIIKMTPARFVKLADHIRNSELTVESRANIDQVIQGVRDHFLREQDELLEKWQKASTPEQEIKLREQILQAEANASPIYDLDADLAGAQGMALKQRDGIFISGKGYSMAELKEEFPDLSEAELLVKKKEAIEEGIEKTKLSQVRAKYDAKLKEALENNDPATYLKLSREKREELNKVIDDADPDLNNLEQKPGATKNKPKRSLLDKFKHQLLERSKDAVELTIGNVFSVSTLLLNVGVSSLKTIYRPALDFALGGKWNKQARLEMMAGYAGIKAMRQSAFKAAAMAFKYEKQIATFETNKMFDEDIRFKGITGSVIRLFPRLLLASDAFLQDINYRGFVSARATDDAYEEGVKKGLKGSELDAFINNQVKTKLDEAYDTSLREQTVDAVYRKGVAKKLKGEELENWVADELVKNESGLFSYNDQGAIEYSNDILFKKEFSGAGLLSGSAKKYEKFVREWPVAKLLLNLFWRTPVRVFEEGIRLTPALNVLSTQKFRDDLLGKNGNKAMLRARGEMLLGQALTMETMTMLAAGTITGANDPEHPYSIQLPDGSWWSYRLSDPISTPIKIIANTMENYQILLLRQQQEGITDKGELERFWEDATRPMSAALVGLTTTIADARLLTGFSQTYEDVFGPAGLISQAVNDPTDEDKPILTKKFFDVVGAMFPRQIYKLYEFEDPTRYQTASFEQLLRKQGLPYHHALEEYADPLLQQLGIDLDIDTFKAKLTPSYDVNGMPITNPDPMASNIIFNATQEEEFRKGLNETQIFNREKMFQLGLDANTYFYHPYRYKKGYGEEDLRTLYAPATKNRPEESYMSRWMHHYRSLRPDLEIKEVLMDDSIAVGTPSNSPKVKEIRAIMRDYKEEAWDMLAEEVPDVMDRIEEKEDIKSATEDGFFDILK